VETAAFDYELPAEAIAQHPLVERDAARLLVDQGPGQPPDDRRVRDLPDLLRPGDLLVVNTTRVRRARLTLRKPTGGTAEVLLLHPRPDGSWEALVRPSRRLAPGTDLLTDDGALGVDVGEDLGGGRRVVRLAGTEGEVDVDVAIERSGGVPLPPYITEPLADPDRYQTVFADRTGSSAAPTAGLHLTQPLLDRCRAADVGVATVDLEIGLDTFRPITAEKVDDHPMHTEHYRVPAETMAAVESAERVVAVGTTVVRSLEAASLSGELEGATDLYIRASFEFRCVDLLLTNFHFPRSTLLVLVDAFVGPRWRDLYGHALSAHYRFLSFGDALLLERSP
jgi:S-adenosylmethionine:tRNA ribosyltransferase-isomerase